MTDRRHRDDDQRDKSDRERRHRSERDRDSDSRRNHKSSRDDSSSRRESRGHRENERPHERSNDRKRSRSASPEPFILSDSSRAKYKERLKESLGSSAPEPIDHNDYFAKATPFKLWLRDRSDPLYLDEMSTRRSKRYFEKFAMEWNRGKLSKKFYGDIEVQAKDLTRYKWRIKTDEAEQEALEKVKDAAPPKKRLGPIGPSLDDIRMQLEQKEDDEQQREMERRIAKKRESKAFKEDLDEIAPKATGHEAVVEKKRLVNEHNRELREKEETGGLLEFGDAILMGGDDYSRRVAAQKSAAEKRDEKRRLFQAERAAEMNEKMAARREKEAKTMEMLRGLAAQKYGT